MNRPRQKSIATQVKRRIGHRPNKAIWSFRDFSDLDATAVAAILSRLAKSGELRRIRKGRAVDRPTRIKSIRGIKIRTVTRPLVSQKGITEDERVALDALRNIRRIPDTTIPDTLKRIQSLLRDQRLQPTRLVRFALAEPPRVRALVGALVESLGCKDSYVHELRKSLNPLTTYRLGGIEKVLPEAATWYIKK